jgi:hypothetical protein
MRRRIALTALVVITLAAAGTAGAVIRDVVTPRGKAATFAGDRALLVLLQRSCDSVR